ncbi:MBL fold metallo-hydrolase [Patescibacteria group bacterium]|nr:MBL fold metallo-hydrolase [Patescibacteria group bacterium]
MFDRKKLILWLVATLSLGNFLIWQATSFFDGKLHVYFLNVGQGDSILIRTPNRQTILVDGGPDDAVIKLIDRYLPIWQRQLDLVVATHPETDHITGLVDLLKLKRLKVKRVLSLLTEKDTAIGRAWSDELAGGHYRVDYASASSDYNFGDVQWDTLYPLNSDDTAANINDSAIVARLIYQQHQLLLTADASSTTEATISNIYGNTLRSDILKVGHHGSKSSSSDGFLQLVSPAVAAISVGENGYGHPTKEALTRILSVGANIYRTDLDDTIEVIFTNNGYIVKTNGQKEFYSQ